MRVMQKNGVRRLWCIVRPHDRITPPRRRIRDMRIMAAATMTVGLRSVPQRSAV
jgi:hypothetical protein